MTPQERRAVLAAVEAEGQVQDRIVRGLVATLRRLWRTLLLDPFDPGQVGEFATAAGKATGTARAQAAGAADAYLRRVLDVMDAPSSGRPSAPVPEPRGIPLVEEWSRPAATARRLRVEGLDALVAEERALQRAEVMGSTDLLLAKRDATARRLASADRVTGWRRVLHPELSAGGVCGLCIAASDRVYRTGELQDIHERCRCEVLPIVGSNDPGRSLNAESLAELYRLAGGTAGEKLKRVRYVVQEHGELGPVLANAEHEHRSPADVAADRRAA